MRKILVLGLLGVLVLMIGCVKTPTGKVVEAVSFQELCESNGNMFMTMPPTVDGVPTGEPPCAGCMLGGTHYCSQEAYQKALASGKHTGDMGGMDDMPMG